MKFPSSKFLKSDFLKNVMTLFSATAVAQAISLAIYPVLTRIYDPAEHGLFSLYLSTVSITGIIATGKYELGVLIPKEEKDGAGLTILGIRLSFFFSLFLLVFILLFRKYIPGWLGNEGIDKWLLFIPLSTFTVAIFQSLTFWFNRKRQYKTIAGGNLGQSILNSAVKLSASNILQNGGGLVVGAISGQVIGAILYLWRLGKQGIRQMTVIPVHTLKGLAKEYRYFPRYSLIHNLVSNFSTTLPIFVFSHYFPPETVGFFGFGYMLIHRPLNLLSGSISRVLSQQTIDKYNKGMLISGNIRKFTSRMALFAVAPFLVVGLIAPWLVTFIFGDDWFEAGRYIQIFTPWLYVVFLAAAINWIPDMLSRQRKAMNLELIKFGLRIVALSIGVITKNIYLALILFSAVSLLVMVYSLFWYLHLARAADLKSTEK